MFADYRLSCLNGAFDSLEMLFCFRFHKPFSVTARFFLDEGLNQGYPLYPHAAGEHSVKKGIGI